MWSGGTLHLGIVCSVVDESCSKARFRMSELEKASTSGGLHFHCTGDKTGPAMF